MIEVILGYISIALFIIGTFFSYMSSRSVLKPQQKMRAYIGLGLILLGWVLLIISMIV